MHKFPILFFQSVLPVTKNLLEKPDTVEGFLCSFTVSCITVSMCYMGTLIIRKIAPMIINIDDYKKQLEDLNGKSVEDQFYGLKTQYIYPLIEKENIIYNYRYGCPQKENGLIAEYESYVKKLKSMLIARIRTV